MDGSERYVKLDEGLVSRKIFFDPEIYQAELERIFARCWLFLGHESQIPEPGDYITAYMGENPILVCRGRGRTRAFVSEFVPASGHESMPSRSWQCASVHLQLPRLDLWQYRRIEGRTSGQGCLRRPPDKSKWGLLEVPKLAIYGGMIFGNWDAGAESLDDFLGEFRWYLDVMIERQVGGIEFIPGIQRYS